MSFDRLRTIIVDGDDEKAEVLTTELLDDGADPLDVIEKAVKPALVEVSEKLDSREMFIPDLILAGEAAKVCINLVAPALASRGGGNSIGTIVLGVVEGDTHDIGKDLVRAMLIAAGFEVIDLETNVSPDQFIEAIKKHKPQVVGASAYTSASAQEIARLNVALQEAGLRDGVKLLIGGAAVYRDDIMRYGADEFGQDAVEAVSMAKLLVGVH